MYKDRTDKKLFYKEVNYKYILTVPFSYKTSIRLKGYIISGLVTLWTSGELVCEKGYAWDGPSGPTWDSRCAMRAALVHDALYQLMRNGVLDHKYRKVADKIFYQILKEDGMNWLRRLLWWRAVRRFAAYAIQPRDDSVKSAP
ncbi:MAG: DUF1353 domain-containing protein [Promethearchaeota archaeon]